MSSDLFYTVNWVVSTMASLIGLIFGFLIIFTVIINRQCYTMTNLLICNTTVAIISFTIIVLLSNIYGLRQDWLYQPACVFRAICFIMVCAVVCYSYLIQAISRLFFVIFYKYKRLQTCRTHWIMIVISWLSGIFVPILMFLIDNNAFVLEEESRFCIAASNIFVTSIYCMIGGYVMPLGIITIIYGIIFKHARQSTRRVAAIGHRSTANITIPNTAMPNIKRELKLMKNMMIPLSLLTCAGTPRLILVLWYVTFKEQPPKPLYYLSLNSLTISAESLTVITFFMSKEVKKRFCEYLRKLRQNGLLILLRMKD